MQQIDPSKCKDQVQGLYTVKTKHPISPKIPSIRLQFFSQADKSTERQYTEFEGKISVFEVLRPKTMFFKNSCLAPKKNIFLTQKRFVPLALSVI